MNSADFWRDRSVFITGCTGFKGGWISLWLSQLGARVYGYSLEAPTIPNFFTETQLQSRLQSSTVGDIRDLTKLISVMQASKPSIVIHMAAQPLVLDSYKAPVETYMTNIMGTVNLLEAIRLTDSVEAVVSVTTDKCYENQEWVWPYRENDRLGGHDPYSSSKACAEIVTAAYRNSFLSEAGVHLASVRAGNVIGGGDWAPNRLIPDFFRASEKGETLRIRSPNAVRSWQHVLEPLSGYLALAERMVLGGAEYAQPWNFGSEEADAKSVSWILDQLCQKVPNASWKLDKEIQSHEAQVLKLDSAKAKEKLGWSSRWSLKTALNKTVEWHLAWKDSQSMVDFSIQQIQDYEYS